MGVITVQLRVSTSGIEKLNNAKALLPEAVTLGVQRVALYFRDNCVLMAQAGHPSHPNVITGRLSGSMRIAPIRDGINAARQVGSDAKYAPFVELGHMSRSWGSDKWHAVPAYPWFQPAIVQTFDSGDAQTIFLNTIKEVLGV
jgi:hypothetical protein